MPEKKEHAIFFQKGNTIWYIWFLEISDLTTAKKYAGKLKDTEKGLYLDRARFISHDLYWQTSSICFLKISNEAQTLHNL